MRYLTSISLALVVHVLLSIGILMALACTATPATTPTPAGPMYSEEEAMAILKEHLQTKILAGENAPCLLAIEWYGNRGNDKQPGVWNSQYDESANRWDVSYSNIPNSPMVVFTWSVYERTKSIVATGDESLNQMC